MAETPNEEVIIDAEDDGYAIEPVRRRGAPADYRPNLNLSVPDPEQQFWASWPIDSSSGLSLALKCLAKPSLQSGDILNKPLEVWGIFANPYRKVNPADGEVLMLLRLVLVLADNSTVSFVSAAVTRAIRLIIQAKGPGPWEPPLKLMIRQVQLEGAKRTYDVTLVEDEPTTKKGRK